MGNDSDTDNARPQKSIPKWGFGMAPISQTMMKRYLAAIDPFITYLGTGSGAADHIPDLEAMSELKGMFNRCLKQDQWDWFSVYQQFGFPDRQVMRTIVGELAALRIKVKNSEDTKPMRLKLQRSNLLQYIMAFRTYEKQTALDHNSAKGWIYILSTREDPKILKIGMTKRDVEVRVKEINSATGILVPFGARRVFPAADASQAEREIFALLSEYRVRPDREFFRMPLVVACTAIETYFKGLRGL